MGKEPRKNKTTNSGRSRYSMRARSLWLGRLSRAFLYSLVSISGHRGNIRSGHGGPVSINYSNAHPSGACNNYFTVRLQWIRLISFPVDREFPGLHASPTKYMGYSRMLQGLTSRSTTKSRSSIDFEAFWSTPCIFFGQAACSPGNSLSIGK